MSKVITAPGVLKNVQGQIDHVTDMYDDIKDNNLKPLTVTLDPIENANGAYSHTTSDDRITEDMKPVTLEVGTPESFYAPVTVTAGNGSATVACADAHGNSTIIVTFVKTSPVEGGADYPPAVTSTEFDILADRIGSLATLDTSTKASAVAAINEVVGNIGTVPSGKTVEGQIDELNGNIKTKADKSVTVIKEMTGAGSFTIAHSTIGLGTNRKTLRILSYFSYANNQQRYFGYNELSNVYVDTNGINATVTGACTVVFECGVGETF